MKIMGTGLFYHNYTKPNYTIIGVCRGGEKGDDLPPQ